LEFVERVLSLARFGFRRNHETVDLRIADFGAAQRDIEVVVLSVFAEETALGLRIDADDSVLRTIHHYSPADSASRRQQRPRHVRANHGHVKPPLLFFGREETAGVEVTR